MDHQNWYVVYTKPRHEKFVETQLTKKGFEAFTPKATLRKRWSDRIKYIKEPIFKNYCFVKFSLLNKAKIMNQQGISAVIHFNKEYIPVPENTINSLKILTQTSCRIDPCPYIRIGDYVCIKKGLLKGLEGFVLEKRNKNADLVISVEAIATSIKCIVDTDSIESA